MKLLRPILLILFVFILGIVINPRLFNSSSYDPFATFAITAGPSSGEPPAPPVPPPPPPPDNFIEKDPTITPVVLPSQLQSQSRNDEAKVRETAKLDRIEYYVQNTSFEKFVQQQSSQFGFVFKKLQAEIHRRWEVKDIRYAEAQNKEKKKAVQATKKKSTQKVEKNQGNKK